MIKRTAKKSRKTTPRKASSKAAAPSVVRGTNVLVLRTCPPDMVARGEHKGVTWAFTWPRSGPVECPDWDPAPKCGHGLHGLLWGNGDWSLLKEADDSVWLVVEVDSADLVKIDNSKVKFRRGNVLFAGAKAAAIVHVMAGDLAMKVARQEAEAWDRKSGDSSKAASSGNYSKAASSGNSSTAASSGNSSTAASSGNSSTAASSGDYSKAASSGDYGIAVTIGDAGRAKAGPLGLVIVTYWVAAEKRYRACVGNVGEGGILADTWYAVKNGQLVKAD
jgi:hypothetical protein